MSRGRIVQRLILAAAATYLSTVANRGARAAAIDVEFNDIAVGTTYSSTSLPRTITTSGVDVTLSRHPPSTVSNGRIVQVTAGDNALFAAANLRAEVVLTAPSTGGFFLFRNQGGSNLLQINGQSTDFRHNALVGAGSGILGGVSFSSGSLGAWRSVKLEGPIYSLAFVGQELSIDSIALTLLDAPPLPGDFDLDGMLTGDDVLAWQLGASPHPLSPDDLAAWSAAVNPPELTSRVPEPTSLALVVAAIMGATSVRCLRDSGPVGA